jgi:hypothetical protein
MEIGGIGAPRSTRLRIRPGLALVAGLAWLAALGAPPARAELLPVQVELSIDGIGGGAPVGTATGMASVNGSGGGAHLASLALSAGLVATTSTSTPATPTLFTKLIVSVSNASGSFTAGGAGLAGVLPLPGNVRLCLLLACAVFVDLPLTESGTRGVGVGGSPISVTVLGVNVALQGASWSTGVVSAVSGSTPVFASGFAHGPLSLTSSTAQPGGEVQLVTPIAVSTSDSGGPIADLALFGRLTVHFVPEPGNGLALALGAAAVFALGRRRR